MNIKILTDKVLSLEKKVRCLSCAGGGSGTYTFTSGITELTGTVYLGGSLTQDADINGMVNYGFDAYNLLDFGLQTAIQTGLGRAGIGGFDGNLEFFHRWENSTFGAYIKLEAQASSASLILRSNTVSLSSQIEILHNAIKVTGLSEYADDTAAATGGVPVDGLYRTGSVLKIRVA